MITREEERKETLPWAATMYFSPRKRERERWERQFCREGGRGGSWRTSTNFSGGEGELATGFPPEERRDSRKRGNRRKRREKEEEE